LKSELKLTGPAEAHYEKFTQLAKWFLAEEARAHASPRSVSAIGATRFAALLDSSRNRYTMLEEIDEHARRLVASLSTDQRTLFNAQFLPMPSSSSR
jgi:hypothetical protein